MGNVKTLITDIDSVDIDKIALLSMLDGDMDFDPEYEDSNYNKTQEDKKKKEMDEYEAYNLMHSNDGINNKCVLSL